MRGLILFATIAALLGAPSIVSGAPDPGSLPGTASRIVPAADGSAQAEEPGTGSRDGTLDLVLMVGLSGVAAVAIIGTGVLAVGRRRPEEPGTPSGSTTAAEAAEQNTEALLQRRIVRRSKVRLADDPIVAAMGVEDQVNARRRRGATRPAAGERGDRPPRGLA